MAETSNSKAARSWRVIAEEASREFDAGRMAELMRELNQALEEQGLIDSDAQDPKKVA